MIGHTISQYRILEVIGEGGMGVVCKAILVCGILIPNLFFRSYDTSSMGGFFLSPFPWVIVGGMTINHGLQMFSGTVPDLPTITTQVSCLVSILTVFVISPTLFLFGLRTRAVEQASGKELHILRWSTIQFIKEDNGVDKYYDPALLGTYGTRYNLFTAVIICLAGIAVFVPLIQKFLG